MKKILAAALFILGVALLLLGLLFLVGSAGKAGRLAIAGLGLLLGAGAIIGAILLARHVARLSHPALEAAILELAKRGDGEVSELELRAHLGKRWKEGRVVLESMLASKDCHASQRDGTRFYVFKDLLARLAMRFCEFCDSELPLTREVSNCPNCGGTVTTTLRSLAASRVRDSYSMDE